MNNEKSVSLFNNFLSKMHATNSANTIIDGVYVHVQGESLKK